jgi:acyl-CoA thioesterase I
MTTTRWIRFATLFGLLALLSACGAGDAEGESPRSADAASSGAKAKEAEETLPKVIVLGDSIAAGLHLDIPLDESFPALLELQLEEAGHPFDLVNAGVSGDTTAGGRSRLAWMLSQNPDLLVVELGANDGLRGVALTSIEENLSAIVRGAREAGVPVLLLGMRLPPNLGQDYVEGFAAIYERVGKLEGVRLVPFFMEGVAGVPDLNWTDGIHPTAEGHRILAETVRPHLAEMLREL